MLAMLVMFAFVITVGLSDSVDSGAPDRSPVIAEPTVQPTPEGLL
jgi:hypothetical protein